MPSYYITLQQMYNALEKILAKAQTSTLCEIEYRLTKEVPVSALSIRKRIELLQQVGKVEIEGDQITWTG
jgi:hypothetical protein